MTPKTKQNFYNRKKIFFSNQKNTQKQQQQKVIKMPKEQGQSI